MSFQKCQRWKLSHLAISRRAFLWHPWLQRRKVASSRVCLLLLLGRLPRAPGAHAHTLWGSGSFWRCQSTLWGVTLSEILHMVHIFPAKCTLHQWFWWRMIEWKCTNYVGGKLSKQETGIKVALVLTFKISFSYNIITFKKLQLWNTKTAF